MMAKMLYGYELNIPKDFIPVDELRAINDIVVDSTAEDSVLIGTEFVFLTHHVCLKDSNFLMWETECKERLLESVQVLLSYIAKRVESGDELPELPENIDLTWFLINNEDS